MRHFHLARVLLALAIATSVLLGGSAVFAADLPIPPRHAPQATKPPPATKPPREISLQQGPANCGRWTDECVNCTREAAGEAAVCSNPGFACQPKAIRCLGPVPQQSQTK
jgi:hypothetical protein